MLLAHCDVQGFLWGLVYGGIAGFVVHTLWKMMRFLFDRNRPY
jgi:hypothetical protein